MSTETEGFTITRWCREPLAVDAVQLTEDADWDAIAAWCGGKHRLREYADGSGEREGVISFPGADALESDWIVRSAAGFFAVWDDAAFRRAFSLAEASAAVSPPADTAQDSADAQAGSQPSASPVTEEAVDAAIRADNEHHRRVREPMFVCPSRPQVRAMLEGAAPLIVAADRERAESAEARAAALEAALSRHMQWFTEKGTRICGGCLRPSPCPDAALASEEPDHD